MTSTSTAALLVELFVEELPPKALKALGAAFASALQAGLAGRDLIDPAVATWEGFATPRRLGVLLPAVRALAPDRSMEIKLMPVAVGLAADGAATPALLKKLASLGAAASVVPALERRGDGKSEVLYYAATFRGATLAEGLQAALDEAMAGKPVTTPVSRPYGCAVHY